MKFNIKKFKRDGYFIIKNIIKPSKIKKFNQEISQITKIISKENKSSSKKFAEAFENSKKRCPKS